ncbi:MAG TPA: hypothetical protein VK020_06090 [Microlunatus sp.]|nr:hypothetical protein [Microlunatus sp.]
MQIPQRLGLALALALLATAAAAVPAWAGGPTSALIVNPATGRTAAAHHSDSLYSGLAAAVGLGEGMDLPTTSASDHPSLESAAGAEVRITWLVHDVAVWRVDRVLLLKDAVWLQTSADGSYESRETGWQRAPDPDRLRALLAGSGVLSEAVAEPPPPARESTDQESAPADRAAAAADGGSGPGGVAWVGLGTVIGAGLGVAGSALLRRRRGPDERVLLNG